jgi:hypothetical protein
VTLKVRGALWIRLVCCKNDDSRLQLDQVRPLNVKQREILIIAVLLITTLIFGFALIPIGISEGFGDIGPGLSPRFMPELATAGIAIALAFGLARYLFASRPEDDTGVPQLQEGGHPLRAVVAISICLFFAIIGFRVTGFYLGGITMALMLTLLLGERRLINALLIPVLVLTIIYLVFEIGFQIRLPKSNLIPGVPI